MMSTRPRKVKFCQHRHFETLSSPLLLGGSRPRQCFPPHSSLGRTATDCGSAPLAVDPLAPSWRTCPLGLLENMFWILHSIYIPTIPLPRAFQSFLSTYVKKRQNPQLVNVRYFQAQMWGGHLSQRLGWTPKVQTREALFLPGSGQGPLPLTSSRLEVQNS